MNNPAVAWTVFAFVVGILLLIVVGPLVTRQQKENTAPQLAAIVDQQKAPGPAPEAERSAKSATLFEYTKWGMSPAELEQIGAGTITRTSPDRLFPDDHRIGGSRGTALDVKADVLLKSSYNTNGIFYDAIYYFNSNRLFNVTLVPRSIDDGIKTGRLLEGIYGAPEATELTGREVGSKGCILRKRWRSPSEGNLITFFNKCDSRFELRYEPVPAKGGL